MRAFLLQTHRKFLYNQDVINILSLQVSMQIAQFHLYEVFSDLSAANIWMNGAMCTLFSKRDRDIYQALNSRFTLYGLNLQITRQDFTHLMSLFLEYCGRPDLKNEYTNLNGRLLSHDTILQLTSGAPSIEHIRHRRQEDAA